MVDREIKYKKHESTKVMKKRHAKKKITVLMLIHDNGNVCPAVKKWFGGSYWNFSEYMQQLRAEGFWDDGDGKIQLKWKAIWWMRKLKVKSALKIHRHFPDVQLQKN
jgi:hypothetical protein